MGEDKDYPNIWPSVTLHIKIGKVDQDFLKLLLNGILMTVVGEISSLNWLLCQQSGIAY